MKNYEIRTSCEELMGKGNSMTMKSKAILNYLILSYIAYHDLNNAAIYHDVDDMNIWLSEYEHFNTYPYGDAS